MRFRSSQQPRGVLTVRDQRRLTLLIVGIAVVLIGMGVVRRPGFWAALFPEASRSSAAVPAESDRSALQSDEFLGGSPDDSVASQTNVEEWIDRAAARKRELGVLPGTEDAPILPSELARTVRDDVIGVHSVEADAYFVSLRLAAKLTPAERSEAPTASYALLMDAPASCRGRVWKLSGVLRKIDRVRSDANAFGVRSLVDAWVSTPDSGSQLIHVIASSADPALFQAPVSAASGLPVQFTGLFFKREGYRRAGRSGEGDIGLTPLILAGRLRRVTPETQVVSRAEELTPWLGWTAAAVCAGVLLMLAQFQLSDRGFRGTRSHQLTALPPRPGFQSVEATSIVESLRQMEQPTDAPQSSADSSY